MNRTFANLDQYYLPVVSMFSSIDSKIGIESVINILLNRGNNIPSSEYIIEALCYV